LEAEPASVDLCCNLDHHLDEGLGQVVLFLSFDSFVDATVSGLSADNVAAAYQMIDWTRALAAVLEAIVLVIHTMPEAH
jgi:hypothetical protein